MKVVIRTEANCKIGLGHFMRMLSFAEWLRIYGWQVVFVMTSYSEDLASPTLLRELAQILAQKKISVHWLANPDDRADAIAVGELHNDAHWMMLDAYSIGEKWLEQMAALGYKTAVVNDHPQQQKQADVIIDPTLFAEANNAQTMVGLTTTNTRRYFVGAHYGLNAVALAKQHFQLEATNSVAQSIQPPIENWFVSFGGTDVGEMLPHTIISLADFANTKTHLTVAVNDNVQHIETIKSALNRWPGPRFLVSAQEAVIFALAESQFAIGAAGGMTIERALLGIPSLVTMVADNQALIFRRLQEHSLSFTALPEVFCAGGQLREKLAEILRNPLLINTMRARTLGLSQGLGGGWIAQYFGQSAHQPVYLQRPTPDFKKRLFSWQSLPEVRRYARNVNAPSWQEHCAWYDAQNIKHNVVLAEIIYQQSSVGMVRLEVSRSQPLSFEVSILLDPVFHGRGIAKTALDLLRKLVPFGRIRAFIKPDNAASLRVFAAAGYMPEKAHNYFFCEAIYADQD